MIPVESEIEIENGMMKLIDDEALEDEDEDEENEESDEDEDEEDDESEDDEDEDDEDEEDEDEEDDEDEDEEKSSAANVRLGYRFLTGPDTRAFCEKVSAALADGYVLYGPPVLTYDDEKAYCGQAVILRELLAQQAPPPARAEPAAELESTRDGRGRGGSKRGAAKTASAPKSRTKSTRGSGNGRGKSKPGRPRKPGPKKR